MIIKHYGSKGNEVLSVKKYPNTELDYFFKILSTDKNPPPPLRQFGRGSKECLRSLIILVYWVYHENWTRLLGHSVNMEITRFKR